MCKSEQTQRTFRSRTYLPEEKESDEHVLSYAWLAEHIPPVHPPYYFLFYCPFCHFTDLKDDFISPANNSFYSRLKDAFLEASLRDKKIMEFISRHINYDKINYRSAVNLHFLAIFTQMLLPPTSCDSYKLGRLLLRLAWLYRENTPNDHGLLQIPKVDEIQTVADEFEASLTKTRNNWLTLSTAIRERVAELDPQFQEIGAENPYRGCHNSIALGIEAILKEMHSLKTLCTNDLSGALLDKSKTKKEPYYSFDSYEEYFGKLKIIWPTAPADEKEAMRVAISQFDRAMMTDERFNDHQKHFSLISLIADLMVRCGDLNGAFLMIRSIHKAASDTRQRFKKELQNKDIDQREQRRIETQLERSVTSIAAVNKLRHNLLDQIMNRDREKIDAIIAQNQGAQLAEIEQTLEKNDIIPELVTKLKSEGGPLEALVKKKRGFFSKG